MDLRNCRDYIEGVLKIRDKRGEIVPFRLNRPQARFYGAVKGQREAGRPVRALVLKARQMGFSTLIQGMLFWADATRRNVNSLTTAHQSTATTNLFNMNKRYYDYLPDRLKPMRRASNAQELLFAAPTGAALGVTGLDSSMKVSTAGGMGVGRSATLTNAHLSEFAYWPGDKAETLNGIMQAIPDEPGTMVFIESTANGFDTFKDMWDKAVEAWDRGERDGWMPFFAAWWEMEEYRRRPEPGFCRTGREEALAEAYGLDDEQLAWRRWCIKTNCGGDERKFRQEYPASPDEAFLSSGSCIFDQDALVERRQEVRDAGWERGVFRYDLDEGAPQGRQISNIRWEPDPAGFIRVRARPQTGYPYVIGGDTAGTGSDKFTGQVLDNISGAQAAVLQHQFDEALYARQMYCLGWWYGWALIGVETNYSTYPEMELERLGYPNLFTRKREDTFTGRTVDAYGFETTSLTRPIIIDGLKAVAREHLETIGDYETLGEMLSFVYNEKYRPEALEGKHDDLVMALAIAHYIRSGQRRSVVKPKVTGRKRLTEKYRSRGTR